MNTAVATQQQYPLPVAVEDVIARGDLSKLTPEQRVMHIHNVCDLTGINPSTQPFQYITLGGKLVLYATRAATDQLRKINGISLVVASRTLNGDLLTVHVRATDKTGRSDEDFGVVSIGGLRGEAAANAAMKAITKAKRRVTLSISGLGYLDESEVADIPGAQPFQELAETTQLREEARQEHAALHPSMPQNERSAAVEQRAVDAVKPAPPHEETAPYMIPRRGDDADDWSAWATTLLAYVRVAARADTINEWTTLNAESLAALEKFDASKHTRLIDMINHQLAGRAGNDT